MDIMPRQLLQPVLSSLAPHRIFLYSFLSSVAVAAVVANALKNHSNFYAVTVYLSKSNGTVMVLANFGLLVALIVGRVLQQIFFGPLRAPEVERLYDRMWFFVTESLLAFTIFRDEFDVPFALMFGGLLFTKCFHWLLSDRIEWMDQRPYPGPPMLFHVRINALMAMLWLTDFFMFTFAVENIMENGVGGIVLFASEYAILLSSLLNSGAKYVICIMEIRRASRRGGENAPPWEDKSMLIFYVELFTDFLKLVTYLTFFMLVLTFYGLPLNIIRDVYITARSFIMRFRDLIRYRTATRNMDQRYPSATEEELNAMNDRTCIICREEMVLIAATINQRTSQENDQRSRHQTPQQAPANDGPNMTPKKLPCSHVFHFHCLRSWLERQQSCPTCRRTVLETNVPIPTPRPAGAPAPPQPGAVPQVPNMLGLGGAPRQPQQGQQPAGNFGGLFNRLIGAAGAPPVVPGQFAHGPPQFAQGAGVPVQHQNAGWWVPPQQAPHLGFGYPQQFQHMPPQPQAFQGFYAPGVGWQPWAGGQEVVAQAPPDLLPRADAPANSNPPSSESSQSPPTRLQSPGNSSATAPSLRQDSSASNRASTTTEHPLASSSTDTGENISRTPMDPREAAASAALKRSTSSNSIVPGQSPMRSPSSSSRTSIPNGPSTTGSASLGPSPSGTPGPSRSGLPPLIPLYDPSMYQPPPLYQSSPYRTAFSARSGAPGLSPLGNPGVGQPAAFSQSHTSAAGSHPPGGYSPSLHAGVYPQQPRASPLVYGGRGSVSRSHTSILPPTLSDEQLARLDRLTRDAIDERLRVLEGVQGALSRCIDDLVRVRSVLPQSGTAPTQRAGTQSSNPTVVNISGSDESPTATTKLPVDGEANAVEESEKPPLSSGPSFVSDIPEA